MAELIYQEVYQKIRRAIENGTYAAESYLPIEPQLCEIYGVSRTTVRKAIKLLTDEGLVRATQGRGTVVLDRKTPQNYNHVTSVTESLRNDGFEVTTKKRHIDCINAPDSLREELQLDLEEKVIRIQRIQLADGVPVCIMTNYIPVDLVPGIIERQNEFVALYQYLEEQYGIQIDSTDDTIYAIAADFYESSILEIEPGMPLLKVERICYDKEKRPICKDVVKVLANRYKVKISTFGRCK